MADSRILSPELEQAVLETKQRVAASAFQIQESHAAILHSRERLFQSRRAIIENHRPKDE